MIIYVLILTMWGVLGCTIDNEDENAGRHIITCIVLTIMWIFIAALNYYWEYGHL